MGGVGAKAAAVAPVAVGAMGAAGAVGANRAAGATGAAEAVAATGAVGSMGAVGAAGDMGAVGALGAMGAAAAVGGTARHVASFRQAYSAGYTSEPYQKNRISVALGSLYLLATPQYIVQFFFFHKNYFLIILFC